MASFLTAYRGISANWAREHLYAVVRDAEERILKADHLALHVDRDDLPRFVAYDLMPHGKSLAQEIEYLFFSAELD